jgi:hypothetical protein
LTDAMRSHRATAPGQCALTPPGHRIVALVRAGAIFVHGILAGRPDEDALPAAT